MSENTKQSPKSTKSNSHFSKAIVWRESIYMNNYLCKCGKKLWSDGDAAGDLLVDIDNGGMYCPECGWLVAYLTTEDQAMKDGAMRGAEA